MSCKRIVRALATLALFPSLAFATEGGTSSFPRGGEDFLVAVMPPPGFYSIVYATRYSADHLAGSEGDVPLEHFRLRVNAIAPRIDWVKPVSWLGADRWGTLLILPYLDIDLELSPVPGVRLGGTTRGAGDLAFGNGLHWTLGDFQMVNAVDIVAPTGKYAADQLVNAGRNVWTARASHMGTWLHSQWDLSYRVNYDYDFENRDTGYHSGRTMYLNYALGWKPSPATTIGVVGYVLAQVSDDHGTSTGDGNRLRASGFGAALKHFIPNGVFVTAKYFREQGARNGPRGDNYWVYVGFPLPGL